MAETKTFVLLLLIIIFSNFFVGLLTLESNNTILDEINPMSKFTNDLQFKVSNYNDEQKESSFLDSLSNLGNTALLLPVTLLNAILDLMIIISIGLTTIPAILNTIFIAPMLIIILIEYILPLIRGN